MSKAITFDARLKDFARTEPVPVVRAARDYLDMALSFREPASPGIVKLGRPKGSRTKPKPVEQAEGAEK